MTVSGHGGFGVDYHLRRATSAPLRRRPPRAMPNMPEVDLPVEQDAAFDRLVNQYYETLTTAGDRLPPAWPTRPWTENSTTKSCGRPGWSGSGNFSPADVAAMGMNQTANPFQFRKLVFWAASKNVDLRWFGNENRRDDLQCTALVRSQKSEGRRRDARREGLQKLLSEIVEEQHGLNPTPGSNRRHLRHREAVCDNIERRGESEMKRCIVCLLTLACIPLPACQSSLAIQVEKLEGLSSRSDGDWDGVLASVREALLGLDELCTQCRSAYGDKPSSTPSARCRPRKTKSEDWFRSRRICSCEGRAARSAARPLRADGRLPPPHG